MFLCVRAPPWGIDKARLMNSLGMQWTSDMTLFHASFLQCQSWKNKIRNVSPWVKSSSVLRATRSWCVVAIQMWMTLPEKNEKLEQKTRADLSPCMGRVSSQPSCLQTLIIATTVSKPVVTKDIEQCGVSFATQHLWGKGCILGCNHLKSACCSHHYPLGVLIYSVLSPLPTHCSHQYQLTALPSSSSPQ